MEEQQNAQRSNRMQTLLDGSSPHQILTDPFPHLVVENALPEQLCQQLIREFPPLEVFTKGQPFGENQKRYYHGAHALAENHLSPAWKTMLTDFLHPSTWTQCYRLFQTAFFNEFPDFEAQLGKLEQLKTGVRLREDFTTCDVLLDSMLLIHTPVTGHPCVERGPHLKLFDTMYLGYFFLRPEEDEAEGGDLELFSIKPGAKIRLNQRQTVDRDLLKLEKTIPYRANTLVLFLNTSRSIQGLSARTASRFPILNFHFDARFRSPLFTVRQKPGTAARSFLKRNTQRLTNLFSNK